MCAAKTNKSSCQYRSDVDMSFICILFLHLLHLLLGGKHTLNKQFATAELTRLSRMQAICYLNLMQLKKKVDQG